MNVILFLFSFLTSAALLPSQDFFLCADRWNGPQKINPAAASLLEFSEHIQNKPWKQKVSSFSLKTSSGASVPATFFDRGSNVVLILGQGLPAPKESMNVFVQLFRDFDIMLFDYRWNQRYVWLLLKSLVTFQPIKQLLLDEEEEMRAAIEFVHQRKNYQKIVGLGECYSNFLFAKIQADDVKNKGKGPFTHLILDSCWHSIPSFVETICSDPFLPCSPQDGGAPWLLKKITNCPLIKWSILKTVFAFLPTISLENYLANLHIPVLFIYGRNDLMVTSDHFAAIWHATCKERAAFLTPYRHSSNLGNKALYRFICEQFISAADFSAFLEIIPSLLEQ